MPGINIKITATDSEERLPLSQKGIIWFRGANVFQGYLNDPDRTALVFDQEGWFKTGDLGHLDQDGFLHIDGRLSRFSKIGGEMVPHETLEEAIVKITPNEELPTDGSRAYVVVGIPDVDKGEALVLLSASLSDLTPEQELKSIRTQLLEQGLPSLWIPKRMLKCDFIPTLTSGKLDIQACQQLALTLAAT
jgi:acyl-[acyl-carrier-protein]-phospholipid O-acyltransferase/long-chain-fatty-acid--[acyl-carrier-protein] ligase